MKASGIIDIARERVLVTGASGFVGGAVVESLLRHGFRRIRCFTRQSSRREKLDDLIQQYGGQAEIELVAGNLLSGDDCARAAEGVSVIYHLAASTGQKSVPHAFLNSVVTTRNLIEASLATGTLKRFISLSSFAVYTNERNGRWLDEQSPVEKNPQSRGDAYSFSKLKQDELVMAYGAERKLPWVLLRPGVVYGPGKAAISQRVGIDSFGIFLHMGGFNQIPLTYLDNCADAVVLAGLAPGIDGEIFNVVDDDLPSSRKFLNLYKRNVRRFRSIYLPKSLSYLLCYFWGRYSIRSHGQLPLAYNCKTWRAYWKGSRYTNEKLKKRTGWQPGVKTSEGLKRYFEACRKVKSA